MWGRRVLCAWAWADHGRASGTCSDGLVEKTAGRWCRRLPARIPMGGWVWAFVYISCLISASQVRPCWSRMRAAAVARQAVVLTDLWFLGGLFVTLCM